MLLDTASLYFRAYYALPTSMTDPDGRPVNALRGLADFIATLAGRYEPTHLIACWDNDWRPAWRVARLASYKTHRLAEPFPGDAEADPEPPASTIRRVDSWETDPETPDALEQQVPRIVEMLRLAGIPVLGADGYEADDVIGTLAANAPMPGSVVTGDRDLFQVIDDARGVRVLYVTKGVAAHAVMDAAALEERYGVSPAQYPDFALLRGDASDGLPGVAGIGEKSAASLLRRYGDLAGLLAAARTTKSDLKPAQRAKLADAGEYCAAAEPVVAVVRTLATDVSWDELRLGAGCAGEEWEAFAAAAALGGSGERMVKALEPLRA